MAMFYSMLKVPVSFQGILIHLVSIGLTSFFNLGIQCIPHNLYTQVPNNSPAETAYRLPRFNSELLYYHMSRFGNTLYSR